ncbi:RNA-binding S4 domain-containing protein [Undibacterium seohonense]|uniref:RNA-binding S4 domain-containing protein n=1 Tax=Undibacterium seohonense TaxID=1344950 RepID=A0ABR6X2A2_9BURK|nr:RNA-binding S4 domain-containing protein [Undibacterium seohonense]MBC3806937.1 RNA-binding S4 domain-containing protein [Undibacterium seohonense]
MTITNLTNTRIDKWLWAARFFKTRSLATNAVELGRILQNEQRIKPAHAVKVGDMLEIHHAEQIWQVEVLRIMEVRSSATIAQTMYAETAESITKRQQRAEHKRLHTEPAAQLQQRPTKRQRRQLANVSVE